MNRKTILIGVATALVVVCYLFGGEALLRASYAVQKKSVDWNGLRIPTERPIALPWNNTSDLLILRLLKDDWSGLRESYFTMQNTYEERLIRDAHVYCSQIAKNCVQGKTKVADYDVYFVTYSAQFESVPGSFHAYFSSIEPPMTMQFHGSAADFGAIKDALARVRKSR